MKMIDFLEKHATEIDAAREKQIAWNAISILDFIPQNVKNPVLKKYSIAMAESLFVNFADDRVVGISSCY
jgi:hypothetical protein